MPLRMSPVRRDRVTKTSCGSPPGLSIRSSSREESAQAPAGQQGPSFIQRRLFLWGGARDLRRRHCGWRDLAEVLGDAARLRGAGAHGGRGGGAQELLRRMPLQERNKSSQPTHRTADVVGGGHACRLGPAASSFQRASGSQHASEGSSSPPSHPSGPRPRSCTTSSGATNSPGSRMGTGRR